MNKCVICSNPTEKKLCGDSKCRSEFSRQTIRNSLKKHGGEITRFRKTNGMHRPEVRALVSTKLRAMGWKPILRMGNGTGPTIQQQALAAALGWEMELVIRTHKKQGSGYPSCYKADVGNSDLKVAIDVDGNSHMLISRKGQDQKKDELLRSLGWSVVRFSNRLVDRNLNACVQEVLSMISQREEWR